MAILQTAHITTQLLFNALGSTVKSDMRVLRLTPAFQDKALHHVHHNVAGKAIMRRAAKCCMRR